MSRAQPDCRLRPQAPATESKNSFSRCLKWRQRNTLQNSKTADFTQKIERKQTSKRITGLQSLLKRQYALIQTDFDYMMGFLVL